MASKRWSVAVTDLTGTAHLHDLAVEADNWMSALRAGRARIGEEGGVPQGASCAVSPEGVVTILDPISRRRFVLAQRNQVPEAPASVPAPQLAPVQLAAPSQAPQTPALAPAETDPSTGKRKKFQTVAFDASMALPVQPQAEAPRQKQKFQTVAFDASLMTAAAPVAQPTTVVSEPAPRPRSVPPNPLAPVAPSQQPPTTHANVPDRSSAPAASSNLNSPASTVAASVDPFTGASKRKKFQTVAFDASNMTLPQSNPTKAEAPPPGSVHITASVPSQPAAATTNPISVAPANTSSSASPAPAVALGPSNPSPVVSTRPVAAAPQVQMLHQRSEDPTPKNPLTYRERSFVIASGTSRATAEAALLAEFSKLKQELASAKRGKFVNLALFDHRWQERPQRPPVATLQWKDWKGDPELSFPAQPVPPVATTAPDDRLATAFEALQDLPFLSTAAEGLEFAVKLLGDLIASQAIAASLYDINTDELRVVAAAGPSAQERKTQAIPVSAGLFGQAARAGDNALVIADAKNHPDFDPGVDSAPGIDARNMLLRPLVQDGQLFGVLQLTNRVQGDYDREDVNLINYIAERVADFVRQAKLRGRS